MSAVILGLSIALQFTAAVLSLRLIKITGRWRAWSFIAIALTLMGVRRSITFYRVLSGDISLPPDLTAELVALCISILMLAGVILIGPIFRKIQSTSKALQSSEERFRGIFEQAAVGVALIESKTGCFVRINQCYCDMVGYTFEEMSEGKTFQEITHPDDLQVDLDNMKRLLANEIQEFTIEKRYFNKDGSIVWVNLTVSPTWKPGEEPQYHIAVVEDITERKHVEEALKESENKYRTLFEQSADAILIIEEDKFVDCNTATVKMLGYKNKKELLETHPSELSPEFQPDGRNSFEKANEILSTIFEKRNARFEWDHRRQNGEVFPVEVLLTAVPFGERKFIHCVWRDITERKRAEEALRESNERFRTSFADAAAGMVLVSHEHRIIEANQSFCNMLGYSKEELVGILFKDITHPDDVDLSLDYHHKLIAGEIDNYHYEKRYLHKQGHEIWGLLSVSLVRDKDATPLYTVAQIQDITGRKRADEQITYQASHDALTGLVNRREFEQRAERLLSTIRQEKGEHAFCYMDLDQFKVVNDTCGHTAGDELLRQLSPVLLTIVRHSDTLARLGGDEFGVLMEHCSLDDAYRVATSLQKAVQNFQFVWEGHSFKVGVSMGLVPITETTSNLTELLKDADAACYMAKDKGRNRIHIYHAEDLEIAQRHGEMQWVARLNQALEEDRFCLYAQTIVPLDGSTDAHYELLLRMIDEKGKTVPPGAFLPAAERYNLIEKLDRWVVKNAFMLLADNPAFFN